jgi:hypothetical protein
MVDSDKKHVNVDVVEYLTDTELNRLLERLNEIEGFNFSVKTIVKLSNEYQKLKPLVKNPFVLEYSK